MFILFKVNDNQTKENESKDEPKNIKPKKVKRDVNKKVTIVADKELKGDDKDKLGLETHNSGYSEILVENEKKNNSVKKKKVVKKKKSVIKEKTPDIKINDGYEEVDLSDKKIQEEKEEKDKPKMENEIKLNTSGYEDVGDFAEIKNKDDIKESINIGNEYEELGDNDVSPKTAKEGKKSVKKKRKKPKNTEYSKEEEKNDDNTNELKDEKAVKKEDLYNNRDVLKRKQELKEKLTETNSVE